MSKNRLTLERQTLKEGDGEPVVETTMSVTTEHTNCKCEECWKTFWKRERLGAYAGIHLLATFFTTCACLIGVREFALWTFPALLLMLFAPWAVLVLVNIIDYRYWSPS